MKTKLLLVFVIHSFGLCLYAQTINSLIITEARLDVAYKAYVELTNMGDSALHLNNFELGVIHPWDSRIDQTDLDKWFHVGADCWYMLPDSTLGPGESIVFTWHSMSAYGNAGEVWEGGDCWYVRHHTGFWSNDPVPQFIKDSVVTDQVGGVFAGCDGQQAWGEKDVAGITGATGKSILVRKFGIKQGNIDFNIGRGTNTSESEWIVIPVQYPEDDVSCNQFWTAGNHVNANLGPETLISSTVSINLADSILVVPWGIRRGDPLMKEFVRNPGIAWHYNYSASYEDSAYMSVRTGDVLTLYACGDGSAVIPFRVIVSDPPADANNVIPRRMVDPHLSFAGQEALYEVTNVTTGMDTIRGNMLFENSFAAQYDTLMKYLELPPNLLQWEIQFVDNYAGTSVKNGDILKVTSENGQTKEYFIEVSDHDPPGDAGLSSITWPDIPEFYKGIYGWTGDTIPGFQSSKYHYKVVVPYDVPGIPALVALTSDMDASLAVNRAKNLTGTVADRTITFTTKAPDEDNVVTYTVELVKGKEASNVQAWKGEPFISQYCFRQDDSNDFLELVNPGTEPIDLSHYMLTFCDVNYPEEAITKSADWINRYVKYIPGMTWRDSISWKDNPLFAVHDSSGIQPVISSGEVFVVADKRTIGGTSADHLVQSINIDFAHNPWNEIIPWSNAMDQQWAIR